MNKNYTILLLASFTSVTLVTRGQTPNSNQVKNFICNTWRLTQLENPEKRIDVPQEISMVMRFSKDSFFVTVEQGKEYPGKWSYDSLTTTLTTNDKGGIEKSKIVNISDKKFVIEKNFAGKIMDAFFEKVDKSN